MNVDRAFLADAVETSDALFEQFGIAWQVIQHEVLRELEIPAFTADFGADQKACAVPIGKRGGVAITNTAALTTGDTLDVRLARGSVTATVVAVRPPEPPSET
jgi:hypothetical protein